MNNITEKNAFIILLDEQKPQSKPTNISKIRSESSPSSEVSVVAVT